MTRHIRRVQMSMHPSNSDELGDYYRLIAYRVRGDEMSVDMEETLLVQVHRGFTSDDLEAEMRGDALQLARRLWPKTPGLLFESGDDDLLIWEVLQ